MRTRAARPRLVAFDLDGTLTRGTSCIQAVADAYGFGADVPGWLRERTRAGMHRVRTELWSRLEHRPPPDVCAPLAAIPVAPGAAEGIAALRSAGVATVIVSLALAPHVAWFAARLGVDAHISSDPRDATDRRHVYPQTKPTLLAAHAARLGLAMHEVAAVGDSAGDVPMLAAAGHSVYIGPDRPAGLPGALHLPAAPIDEIVRRLLDGG